MAYLFVFRIVTVIRIKSSCNSFASHTKSSSKNVSNNVDILEWRRIKDENYSFTLVYFTFGSKFDCSHNRLIM